jgi:hypothetical protein
MKKLFSSLIAMVVVVVFVTATFAASGNTWDKIILKSRFLVLTDFGGAAVLDRETGLVWEQSPSTGASSWYGGQSHCNDLSVGSRKGWRLPVLQELASLVDPTQSAPALPAGHPFSNVQSSHYWSGTSYALNTGHAWTVHFFVGGVNVFGKDGDGSTFVWCVRGEQGVDPQ